MRHSVIYLNTNDGLWGGCLGNNYIVLFSLSATWDAVANSSHIFVQTKTIVKISLSLKHNQHRLNERLMVELYTDGIMKWYIT